MNLVFLFTFSFVSASLLVYEYGRTIEQIQFAQLTDSQALQHVTSPPIVPGSVSGIIPCKTSNGDDCLVLSGQFQYLNSTVIGNIIIFDKINEKWITLGKGIGAYFIQSAFMNGTDIFLCGYNLFLWENPQNPFSGVGKCNIVTQQCNLIGIISQCSQIVVSGEYILILDSSYVNLYSENTNWVNVTFKYYNTFQLGMWKNYAYIIGRELEIDSNLCSGGVINDAAILRNGCFESYFNFSKVDFYSWSPIPGIANYLALYDSESLFIWNETTKDFTSHDLQAGYVNDIFVSSNYLLVLEEYGWVIYNITSDTWISGNYSLNPYLITDDRYFWTANNSFLMRQDMITSDLVFYQLPGSLSTPDVPNLSDRSLFQTYFTNDQLIVADYINNFYTIWNVEKGWETTNTINDDNHSFLIVANISHLFLLFSNTNTSYMLTYSNRTLISNITLTASVPLVPLYYLLDHFIAVQVIYPNQTYSIDLIHLHSGEVEVIIPLSISGIYSDGIYLYLSGNFQTFNTSILKYSLENRTWAEIDPLPSGLMGVLEFYDMICAYGSFTFDLFGDEVNNIVCGDGTIWYETLYNGVEGSILVSAIVNPSDGNLYLLDNNDNLLMYDGIIWSTVTENIYLIGLYENPKISELPIVKTSYYKWIILGAISAALVVIVIYFLIRRRHKSQYIEIPTDLRDPDELISEKIERIMSDTSIPKINSADIVFIEKVAFGGQGEVNKVLYKGKLAAAKSIPAHHFQDFERVTIFLNEIKLFSSLKHKYIVHSFGIFIDPSENNRIWLVMEYMDMNLKEIMHRLKHSEKLKVAISVAKAMKFLHHEFPQTIIHRDLKPENILINSEGVCKLGDFGLGKVMVTNENTRAVGTPDYMAPERISDLESDNEVKYSEKVDVFSFGVMLSEMYGKKPFDLSPKLKIWQRTEMLKSKIVLPSLPEGIPSEMSEIILKCIEVSPQDRPSFIEIVDSLKKITPK